MSKKKLIIALSIITILVCVISFLFIFKENKPPMKLPKKSNDFDLIIYGFKLPDEKVPELERKIKKDPDDMNSITILLAYYTKRESKSKEIRKKKLSLILQVIKEHPDSKIAGGFECGIFKDIYPEEYEKAEKLWLENLQKNKDNVKIIANAAAFFSFNNNMKSKELYRRLKQLEPDNSNWPLKLAILYRTEYKWTKDCKDRKAVAALAFNEFQLYLNLIHNDRRRFMALPDAAEAALDSGHADMASQYAIELLDKTAEFTDFNYAKAIHFGNFVLGRVALANGDLEKAKYFLTESMNFPPKPHVYIVEPDLKLAQGLLEKGEKEVVLQYLDKCSAIFKKYAKFFDKWQTSINNGEKPHFDFKSL